MANNPNVIDNLKHFTKGVDERRNLYGRPKKFISALKSQGYKQSEIIDCLRTIIGMTTAQIVEASQNPNATALEMIVLKAVEQAIKKGDLWVLETIISRIYGKPKEHIEITTTPEVEAARALYEKLLDGGVTRKSAIKKVLAGARFNGVELTEDDILDADTIA